MGYYIILAKYLDSGIVMTIPLTGLMNQFRKFVWGRRRDCSTALFLCRKVRPLHYSRDQNVKLNFSKS
jgi:hypothetical protein